MFYLNGFFEEQQNGAVEISQERHIELLDGQAKGLVIVSDKQGYPQLTQPAPSMFHEWNGQAWSLSKPAQKAYLSDAKQTKLAEINHKAQDFINEAVRLNEVPDFEVQTWQQQGDEALAWQADESVDTPMLSAIAQARGIDINKLRQAALRKTIAFSQLTATIAGQRQAYVDQLNAAKTVEAINTITVAYQLGAS